MNNSQSIAIERVAKRLNENREQTAKGSLIRNSGDRRLAKNRRSYLRGRAFSAAAGPGVA